MPSYPGGKNASGTYQTIINLIPPHTVYIEPFLGSGAILRQKKPAAISYGIERDRATLEAAIVPATAAGMTLGFFGSWPAGNGDGIRPAAVWTAKGPDGCHYALATIGERAPRLCLYEGNGIDFLESYPFTGSELVYCDPPYLRSERRKQGPMYRHEMTDVDHRRLLRCLRSLKASVIISGYSSPLYAAELKGWNAQSYQAMTRAGTAAEWLWYNYARPVRLHDYRYIGRDFRERERIKRRCTRWKQKWDRMPEIERQALWSVLDGFSEPAQERGLEFPQAHTAPGPSQSK